MKKFLAITFFLFSTASYAQFAVINDKDGYVNIRKNAQKDSNNISDKLSNGHLIYCIEEEGNWTNIDYAKEKVDLDGWVYKDRYILISKYLPIPIITTTTNSVELVKDSIKITVTKKPFKKADHTYVYYSESKSQIELIDNKKCWGTDGNIPHFEYQSITITIGQKSIQLPESSIKNLFDPNLSYTQVHFDKDKNILYLESMNSDGAGGYCVIWKIENGVYKERYITLGF